MNCGFAEAHHNDVALDIYRLFARDAGLHWAGGLAIGGGGMFAGKPLKRRAARRGISRPPLTRPSPHWTPAKTSLHRRQPAFAVRPFPRGPTLPWRT